MRATTPVLSTTLNTLAALTLCAYGCGSSDGEATDSTMQPATPDATANQNPAGGAGAGGGVGPVPGSNTGMMDMQPQNPGAMNPGAMNPGAMNPGAMNPGAMNPGGMNPGAMNPGAMNPGAMNPGAMNGGNPPAGGTFSIEAQLASDVDPGAPGTIGIVTWSTTLSSVTEARIEFGLDTSYGMQAPVDLSEPDYRTLLLGMKPAQTYHFRIVASDGTTEMMSDDQTIETGPPTNAVRIGSFTVHDEGAREPGFIVASYWQGQGSSVAFILDPDGEIVWWHEFGDTGGGIARARMSADGKNMWMITANNRGGSLARVTMDTLDGQTYNATTGSHDITPVEGATMAYLDYGESDCDSIFEIDPSGMTTEVFESQDVQSGGGGGGGFGGLLGCHGNAVRYSQAEDVYTFSDVATDIFVVNRSGGLEWRVSEMLAGGIAAYGGRQHGNHLLENSIVIFANSGGGSNASTVVEYTLDGQEIWSYGGGHFSANLGDVQRLPGGNTLVTYSNDSIVEEVDPQKNVVMEFDGAGSRIGYTLWRPSLYGPPPDIAD